MNGNQWARLLAYVTGVVNQELLLQNEYLAAENRILRAHLPARLRLSDPERCTLAEIDCGSRKPEVADTLRLASLLSISIFAAICSAGGGLLGFLSQSRGTSI